MEQVKLLSMTTIVTVLIWAAADSLVNETATLRVAFEVVPLGGTDMLVDIEPADESRVYEVEVFGPRRLAEDVQGSAPLAVRLGIEDRPTGLATIALTRNRLKTALTEQHSTEFSKLSVVSVQPPELRVMVDHMVTRNVDVTLNRLTLAYEEEPQLERTLAGVRMRESICNELTQSGRRPSVDIAADVERLLKERPEGQRAQVSVLLDSRSFGPGAELTPNKIDVTATVKADRVTVDVPTVPIKPVVSFANLDRPYKAVTPDGSPISVETRTIKVAGPTEDVARLLRGETRAYGLIHLKEADFAELGVMKAWTPEFHLPPNVELAKPPDPIEFKLIDATQTGAGG